MTVGELLEIIRQDYLDDDFQPYILPDTFLVREIFRAQQQVCYRQDLRHLFDAESFRLTLTESRLAYALDPLILRLERVLLNGVLLYHTTLADLDARWIGWRDYPAGTPRQFYIQGRTLYLDRAPDAALDGATVTLQAWRLPFGDPAELSVGDDLEIYIDPEQLAHWVCYRAYLRYDLDPDKRARAAEHLALFNATFGAEVPAKARAELLSYPAELNFAPARRRALLGDSDMW